MNVEAKILVNGKKQKSSYKPETGDLISIDMPEARQTKLEAQDIPVPIVYEDNDIIVVNKPKGMVVHPANGNPDGTLVNAILSICKDSLSGIGGEIRPGIVHRLDKDTSGLLIVAKNDVAHIKMSKQIQDREVIKKQRKSYMDFVSDSIAVNKKILLDTDRFTPKYKDSLTIENNLYKGKEYIKYNTLLVEYYYLLTDKIDL